MERPVFGNLWTGIRCRDILGRRSLGSRGDSKMKTLGMGVLVAVIAGATGVAMMGWVYEGPRRFWHRLRLRQALR
jgi:H+/Cl- antiporter ClcA